MAPTPRFNFQFILNDVCSSFEVKDGDIPAFRLGLAHTAFSIANCALYFTAPLRERPDVYFANLAMFATDDEKIAARGAVEVYQRSAGIAAKAGKPVLAAAHIEALRNTRINVGGVAAARLDTRWTSASCALRETSGAAYAPPEAPPAMAPAMEDDDDDDLKAGACVMESHFTPRAWAGTTATPCDHSPQGTFDDMLVALAVTGAPSAVIWLCPSSAKPIERVMEWSSAVYPWPTSGDSDALIPAQSTRSLTRDYAPSLLDDTGASITDAQFLAAYDASHHGWNIIMVRKGTDDGLLSFAALVKPRMGKSPSSLADETAAATALAATAYEAAARDDARDEAAATESRQAEARAAMNQVLSDQARLKVSLAEAHCLFERKFVAHRGAQSMHADDDAIAAHIIMVDEARRYTTLDESEHSSFDPANLPSLSVAFQERKNAQDASRAIIVAYKASLEDTGTVDDDPGTLARAFLLPLPSPPRVVEGAEVGESGAGDRDRDTDDDATTTTASDETTTATTTTTTTNDGTMVAMADVPSPTRAVEAAEAGESGAVVRGSASDDDADTTAATTMDEGTAATTTTAAPLNPATPPLPPALSSVSPPGSVRERNQGRGWGVRRRRLVVNINAKKRRKHEQEGDTMNAVRRSVRGAARSGTAAVVAAAMGTTSDNEGDREMEPESDRSAGSN